MGQHWHAARPVLAAPRSQPQRHDQRGPAARPRHRDPRRREQLVHRRAESAQELPGGNRLPGPRQPLLLPRPQQRGEHAHAGSADDLRPQLGRGGQGVRSGLRHERPATSSRRANGDLKEVFEEQLHRPMGDSMATQFGRGAGPLDRRGEFRFQRRNRVDRPRRNPARRPRDPPRRTGPPASGRQLCRPLQPARSPARAARGGQQLRRRRAADHRAGRGSQHQGHGADHPQPR